MKARMLMLAALALTPFTGYAHDDAHHGMPGMTQSQAHDGHEGHGGHGQAVGKSGNPREVSRTIRVVMSDDMRFAPAKVNVKRGETIRFAIRNAGKIKHEMVIGSMAELKEHAEMMRKMPEMQHADPNALTLNPSKSGEVLWQFTNAGTVDFACLQPGHFEAGMMGKVLVE